MQLSTQCASNGIEPNFYVIYPSEFVNKPTDRYRRFHAYLWLSTAQQQQLPTAHEQ